MKKVILLLLFIPLVSFGQTPYDKGFQAGFKKGYCQDDPLGCISALPPTSPIPEIGEDFNSYNDGFVRGVIAGKNKKRKDTKSSSLTFRGADKTLVEGAKAAAPKFTPTDLNLSKGSYNNNNKVYTRSEDPVLKGLREDRALANMSISNAKRQMKWTKKTSKGLLKAKLKLGEIKKGDEEYRKLKMESKYGYDPATEESPLLVAMRNNIKRSNERLYGTPNN